MGTRFVILLSTENDYFKENGSLWRSTQNRNEATSFETREKANKRINELSIGFIWPDAFVIEVV